MDLFLLMLIILNPFSQVLYLRELFSRLSFTEFFDTHFRASTMSFTILAVFAIAGQPILEHVFQVSLGSLRVFGGLVNLYVAYRFITVGEGSTLLFRGDIKDLAPQITLPYMIGPGVLWVAILMGRVNGPLLAAGMIAGVLSINMGVVLAAYRLFGAAPEEQETRFAKYMAVLMRTMALFIGAIGVEMIFGGVMEMMDDPRRSEVGPPS